MAQQPISSSLPRSAQSKVNKQRQRQKKQALPKISRKPVSDKDLERLDEYVTKMFRKPYTLKDFQREATIAQLKGQDVMVHAPTGAGKTAIVAAPHAHPTSKGKVSFLVSPLIALQDEQAENFKQEYGLDAIAINSSHGGLTPENMTNICRGTYQVVIISPEMMLTKRFIDEVLKNPSLAQRVLSIVIDEAHVVSHWGADFRKKYGELGILRAILPKGTPFVALSATLPSRVREDVLAKLRFPKSKDDFIFVNIGNDRPNVSLVVRAMQHPMNTYHDLDFIIPESCASREDIQPTWVYADVIAPGADIQDHLESRLAPDLQGQGLIRPYSAAYSQKYCHAVMEQFKAGIVRVLICTDAAGMGCNVPNIARVVQWKLPGTMSSFVQRAGRVARTPGTTGVAILLVEKSAYSLSCEELEIENNSGTKKKEDAKGKGKDKGKAVTVKTTGEYVKSNEKGYAEGHGVKRGAHNGKQDDIPHAGWQPRIDRRAKDEGLLVFVQTGSCRRKILTMIYENDTPAPSVPCCDICEPKLLDQTRPGSYKAPPRQKAVTKGVPYQPTQLALHKWRVSVYRAKYARAQWSYQAILSNDLLELLSAVGPIVSLQQLEDLLAKQWGWWDEYGESLWNTMEKLEMPPLVPLPKKPKGTKRTANPTDVADEEKEEDCPVPAKRAKNGSGGSIQQSSTSMSPAASLHHGTSHAQRASSHTTIVDPPTRSCSGPDTAEAIALQQYQYNHLIQAQLQARYLNQTTQQLSGNESSPVPNPLIAVRRTQIDAFGAAGNHPSDALNKHQRSYHPGYTVSASQQPDNSLYHQQALSQPSSCTPTLASATSSPYGDHPPQPMATPSRTPSHHHHHHHHMSTSTPHSTPYSPLTPHSHRFSPYALREPISHRHHHCNPHSSSNQVHLTPTPSPYLTPPQTMPRYRLNESTMQHHFGSSETYDFAHGT